MPVDEGYFTDAAAAAPAESEPVPQEEQEETATALLPVDFFQGKELEPGSTCTVRVAQVMDDQVSVEYVPEGETEEVAEVPEEPMPAAPTEDMMA